MGTFLNDWLNVTIGNTVNSDLGAETGTTDSKYDAMGNTTQPTYRTVDGETVAQTDLVALGTTSANTKRNLLVSKIKRRINFQFTTAPTAEAAIVRYGYGTTAGTDAGSALYLTMQPSGKVKLSAKGNSSLFLSTNTYVGGKPRAEIYAESGDSTSGKVHLRLFPNRWTRIPTDELTLTTVDTTGSTSGAVAYIVTERTMKYDSASNTGYLNFPPGQKLTTDTDAVDTIDGVIVSSGAVYPFGPSTGGLTRVGAATEDGQALADADDTTYLETAAVSATAQTLTVPLQATVARTGFAVTVRMQMAGTGTVTATVTLLEGTTSRGSLGSISLGTNWTDYVLTLTPAQVAAVTDWTNLYGKIDFTS